MTDRAVIVDSNGRLAELPDGGVLVNDNYTHVQNLAATTWTINHPLGRKPSVTLVDSAGTEFLADVSYPSNSQVVVLLAYPTSGKAYLN